MQFDSFPGLHGRTLDKLDFLKYYVCMVRVVPHIRSIKIDEEDSRFVCIIVDFNSIDNVYRIILS